MRDSWAGFWTSGVMVCILARGYIREIRRRWQDQKALIFMHFHGLLLGNQHKIWSKQHIGKVSAVIAEPLIDPEQRAATPV
jgi:hypothetical protein